MRKKEMIAALNRMLGEEKAYAVEMQRKGEFGAAKLVFAAINEIKASLAKSVPESEATYAGTLAEALRERRREYQDLWDDEDGFGTSVFARAQDIVELSE